MILSENDKILGKKAAEHIASSLNQAIEKKGSARVIFSTGASQFTMFENLFESDIDWTKIEFFHLDEYIGIDENHPASFIKYLKERFIGKLKTNLKKVHFVDTSVGAEAIMEQLAKEITAAPVDLGVIGIGENAHIAFNDPPADFDCEDPFKIVTLDEGCRRQQHGEGWFKTLEDVPETAVTMTVKQIMKCEQIISVVPYKVKAKAVHDTLNSELTNMIPATILKNHPNWTLYLDSESASMIDVDKYI
jgi:glucosamine-6-phosphate deaminase